MMHGRQNIKFCFLCYCVCSVPRFVYFVLSYLSFCIFFVLYLFLVFSFSYTFISTLCFFFLLSLYPFVHLHVFIPYLFISSCCFLFIPYCASYSSSCPRLTDRSLLSTSYPRLHRKTALSALGEGEVVDIYWDNHSSGGVRNRDPTSY